MYVHIGLDDLASEGIYVWNDGDASTYRNWRRGQPNNIGGNQHCIDMANANTNEWDDNSCTQVSGFVVEYDCRVVKQFQGHSYEFFPQALSYADAKTAAANVNYCGRAGHLVTITSEAENTFVESLYTDYYQVWIGLDDTEIEGTFEWVTGEALTFTNWSPNQPDNGGGQEHFAILGWDQVSKGLWNDVPFNYPDTAYIVEYDCA